MGDVVRPIDGESQHGMGRGELRYCHQADDPKAGEPDGVPGEIGSRADWACSYEQSEGPDEKMHDPVEAIDQKQTQNICGLSGQAHSPGR